MSPRTYKWSKLTFTLALAALFCFMFAGIAMAAADVTITADDLTYGCSNDQNVSYKFNATGLNSSAQCFTQGGTSIVITFPTPASTPASPGFYDLTPAVGMSVPVKVYVETNDPVLCPETRGWYFAQPTPVIVGNVVTLNIPALDIANPSCKYVTRIVVGDQYQDLKVNNPCPDGIYCIDMKVIACDTTTMTKCFPIYNVPDTMTLTVPTPLTACAGDFTVTGVVKDCAGRFLADTDVVVNNGNGASKTVTTNSSGFFNTTLPIPDCVGGYTVTATATHFVMQGGSKFIPACASLSKTADYTVVGADPVKIVWDPCESALAYNKCNELTLSLLDDCCDNPATNNVPRLINLGAYNASIPPEVAVHFFATLDDCNNDVNQINQLIIPAGQNSITFWGKPIVIGALTLEATSVGLTSAICPTEAVVSDAVELEVRALVWDVDNATNDPAPGPVRAGWPLACATWITNDATTPDLPIGDINGATDEYEVCVSLCDEEGNPLADPPAFTVGVDPLNPTYSEYGVCGNGQCFDHPYCTVKKHFYIYTSEGWANRTIRVQVTYTNEKGDTIQSTCSDPLTFVTGIELQRTVGVDTWQLISTPKYLAKECELGHGTFVDLLDNNGVRYSAILTYDGSPAAWRNVLSSEVVEPLKAYFVKTKQGTTPNINDYVVDYVFERVTSPSGMQPPIRTINRGWNILGIAVTDDNTSDVHLTNQSDYIYRAMGSVYKGSKLVWNPGQYLGNLAKFISASWEQSMTGPVSDDYDDVYNGDGYWAYLTDLQTLAANVGLDLINDHQ